jgi:hypothetical protein
MTILRVSLLSAVTARPLVPPYPLTCSTSVPMQEVGANGRSNTIFLPHTPSGVSDVAAQIRAGVMQGEAGSAGAMVR